MPLLAIDLGLKRIGLAYSPGGSLAVPLNAIIRINRDQAAAEVRKVIDEYRIDHLVVGVPIGGSSEAEMKRRIAHFTALLRMDIKLSYQDEAGTSAEAAERSRGRLGKEKDGRLDSLAAQIILERFLERKHD